MIILFRRILIINVLLLKFSLVMAVDFSAAEANLKRTEESLDEYVRTGEVEEFYDSMRDISYYSPSNGLILVFSGSSPKGAEKIKEIIKSFRARLHEQADWHNYVVKKKALTSLYEPEQERYGSIMSATAQVVADLIKEKVGFRRIAITAQYGRHLAAGNNKGQAYHGFLRWDESYTSLAGSYSALGDRFANLISSLFVNDPSKEKLVSPYFEVERFIEENGGETYYFQFKGVVNGEAVNLSKVTLLSYPKTNFISRTFTHMRMYDLKKIDYGLDHLEKLYNEALTLNGKKLIEKLGELFWWYCQFKPVQYGDPSIAEVIIKSILIFKNEMIPGWKEGIVPWEEAVIEYDPVKFGKNFHELFDYN